MLDAPDAVRKLFDPPAAEFGRSRKWSPFRGRKGRVVGTSGQSLCAAFFVLLVLIPGLGILSASGALGCLFPRRPFLTKRGPFFVVLVEKKFSAGEAKKVLAR